MQKRREQPAVTLREVAEASGVSVSTVSRVLDERSSRSNSPTAERVRRVADDLGYRRNVFAAGLRRGATGTIGMLVPRLTDTVMALMYEAFERAARRRGYFAMVATCGDDPDEQRRSLERLLGRNVDGVVLATARLDDAIAASLRDQGTPHVLVLRTDRVSPSSLGDDETGGYLAVRHLIDLGHHDIGVISGPEFTSSGQDRLAGARRALSEAGIAPIEDRMLSGGYGMDDGMVAGRRLLEGPDRPTAVFAANDDLAIGLVSASMSLGLEPGRDLSIVGYNDIPLVSKLSVPLTSVRTPFDQIATTAIEVLNASATPEEPMRRALPTLIPRASAARLGLR